MQNRLIYQNVFKKVEKWILHYMNGVLTSAARTHVRLEHIMVYSDRKRQRQTDGVSIA